MKIFSDFSGYFWMLSLYKRQKIFFFFTTLLMRLIGYLKGVDIKSSAKFRGAIHFFRFPQSKIQIGENCVFNSSKRSVSVWVYKRCSITTIQKKAKISIGNNCGGTGISIAAARSVTIGDNVLLGANCVIMDTDWHQSDPNNRYSKNIPAKPVVIDKNVFIGYGTIVLKGVHIGENTVIGANSVVVNNIPANSIAMGNPCKVLMKRNWKTIKETANDLQKNDIS